MLASAPLPILLALFVLGLALAYRNGSILR